MKYKLVVKSRDKTWVKARGKNKEHLEERAIAMSKKKPQWTVYVVRDEYKV